MAINIPRGKKDKVIDQIIGALQIYEKAHPKAKIDLYRQSPVSVRIRIVDSSFRGIDKSSRHEQVWSILEQLPDEVQSDISMLVLLAPDEAKMSMGNLEFDDPVPMHP